MTRSGELHRSTAACAIIFFSIIALGYASIAVGQGSVPSAQFVGIQEGQTIGKTVEFAVEYKSNSGAKIARIQLFIDDLLGKDYALPVPQLQGRQRFTWDTTRATDTLHKVSAKVYDAAGRQGTCKVSVYVRNVTTKDVIGPAVSILYPRHGADVSGKVEIGVQATDDNGVEYVIFFVDKEFLGAVNHPPYSTVWDTTRTPNGPHTITAEALDANDNKAMSQEVQVVVNNPAGQTTAKAEGGAGVPEPGRGAAGPVTTPGPEAGATAPTPPAPPSGLAEGAQAPAGEVAKPSAPTLTMVPVGDTGYEVARADSGADRGGPGSTRTTVPGDSSRMLPASTAPSAGGEAGAVPAGSASAPGMGPSPGGARVSVPDVKLRPEAPATSPVSAKAEVAAASASAPAAYVGMSGQRTGTPPAEQRPVTPQVAGGSRTDVARTPVTPSAPTTAVSESAGVTLGRPTLSILEVAKVEMTASALATGSQRTSAPGERLAMLPPAPSAGRGAATEAGPEKLTVPTTPAGVPELPVYVVRRGDTLFRIATKLGTSAEALVALNGIRDPKLIQPGQHLLIPRKDVPSAFVAPGVEIVFDNEKLKLRTPPMSINGVALTPLREIFEHTDGVLFWYPVERRVRAVNDRTDIELMIGSREAKVNKQAVQMELAAFIKRGRTIVPVKFVEDALDVTVQYDPQTNRMYVTSNRIGVKAADLPAAQ